jgi:hypothetical protein
MRIIDFPRVIEGRVSKDMPAKFTKHADVFPMSSIIGRLPLSPDLF